MTNLSKSLIACALVAGLAVQSTGFGAAAAAESRAERDWRGRIAQLGQAADDEIVLTAVGDAIWTHPISTSKDAGLQGLFNVMRASDIAFINFEQVLADSGYPTPKEIAMADPSIISEFVWAGADLVSTANNHLMDFGPSGLQTTVKTLDANGIKHSGAGMTLAEALKPAIIERKGLKVALVSIMLSPTLTIGTAAEAASPGVAWVRGSTVRLPDGGTVIAPWESDLRAMEEAVKTAKTMADVVAVSMHIHWGGGTEIDPTGKQQVARAAVDAGADLIIGHGPHVVNGVEFYKQKPILYSVGNFAFQFPPGAYTYFPNSLPTVKRLSALPEMFVGTMARLILSPQGTIRRIEFLPIALTPEGDPHLVTGEKADGVLEQARVLSEPLGTTVKREGWYAVVEVPGIPTP